MAFDVEVDLFFLADGVLVLVCGEGAEGGDGCLEVAGVVGLGAGEGAEGVEGLEDEVVDEFLFALGALGEEVVLSYEVVVEVLLGGEVGALSGLVLQVHV